MAERRMFHTSVVESDAFLDMPPGAQALYFHIGMHADDDGFVNGPRQITRTVGATADDLQELIDRGFLLWFDGIAVIRHWLVANSLKADRLKPVEYPSIAALLYIRENRQYSLCQEAKMKSLLEVRTRALESKRNPKVREAKVREDKIKENKIKEDKAADAASGEAPDPAASADTELSFMHGELGKGVILLTQEQIGSLLDQMGLDSFDYYVAKLSDYILKNDRKIKNHYATILKWWTEDRSVN